MADLYDDTLDAAVTAINGLHETGVTAAIDYAPQTKLDKLTGIGCYVMPTTLDTGDFESGNRDVSIVIVLACQVSTTHTVGSLLTLEQKILEVFADKALNSAPVISARASGYDQKSLLEQTLFLGEITLTVKYCV